MTEKATPPAKRPWYAKDNLIVNGELIRAGEPVPANTPEHLLTRFHDLGVIAEAPVVEEDVKSEVEPLHPHGAAHEIGSEKRSAHSKR
jgi:hypothetical protein